MSLTSTRPARVLSLDGGGVRGAISIAFLEALEARLAREAGRPVRLCEWFDLIGGTSTGAIIAGGLALGYSAAEMRGFYQQLAPRVFQGGRFRMPGVVSKFKGAALMAELEGIVGERTLETPDLKTRLAIVTKRLDTGSAWVLTNNPNSVYWNTSADGKTIGNRHYPLKMLLRASTAAPHFFDPQRIQIVEGEPPGLFVDGGVSPYNNPAFLMFMVATLPAYGLGFPTGPDKLEITSIGMGAYREKLDPKAWHSGLSGSIAGHALVAQIADTQQQVTAMMSWFGACDTPWAYNAEVGDLASAPAPGGPLFTFKRYDVRLETDWLRDVLGETVSPRQLATLRRIDDASLIPEFYRLGAKAAELQMGS
jgi:uncharacterized protein